MILDAAERLLAARGPDAVGLKDVAREAGVSHALVSHYFGTYAGLVDAALERRAAAARETIFAALAGGAAGAAGAGAAGGAGELDPGALLASMWAWVSDPVTLRLAAWTWLTGRTDAHAFFPARVQGLRLAADALEPRMRARAPRATREDIEFVLGAAVALAWGYSLARPAITASLGRRGDAKDDAFRARVAEMLIGYLASR